MYKKTVAEERGKVNFLLLFAIICHSIFKYKQVAFCYLNIAKWMVKCCNMLLFHETIDFFCNKCLLFQINC